MHLLQNIIKTNEILTFSFLRSVHRPKAAATKHWRKHLNTTPLQNSAKTNEILTFPSLRIMLRWCLALCWLFLEWLGARHRWGNFLFSFPSGVSLSVDCFSYGLGWDTTGAIFCFRKLPQWCLTLCWVFLYLSCIQQLGLTACWYLRSRYSM